MQILSDLELEKVAWYAVVQREVAQLGKGHLTLFRGGETINKWPVITGGSKIDARERSAITPPIEWIMIESIRTRTHPKGHRMNMARIIPFGPEKSFYPNRTFSIHDWPFMIHEAGRSTGCIAVLSDYWRDCRRHLNQAYAECTFSIYVEDINKNEKQIPVMVG